MQRTRQRSVKGLGVVNIPPVVLPTTEAPTPSCIDTPLVITTSVVSIATVTLSILCTYVTLVPLSRNSNYRGSIPSQRAPLAAGPSRRYTSLRPQRALCPRGEQQLRWAERSHIIRPWGDRGGSAQAASARAGRGRAGDGRQERKGLLGAPSTIVGLAHRLGGVAYPFRQSVSSTLRVPRGGSLR